MNNKLRISLSLFVLHMSLGVCAAASGGSASSASTDPAIQAQMDAQNLQLLQAQVKAAQYANDNAELTKEKAAQTFPSGTVGTVTTNSGSLDHFANFAIAKALRARGHTLADQLSGNDKFKAALGDATPNAPLALILTNDQNIASLLYSGQGTVAGLNQLKNVLSIESNNLDLAVQGAQSGQQLLPAIAAVGLVVSAIEGVAATFRSNYTLSSVAVNQDFLQVEIGLLDKFGTDPQVNVIIPGFGSPAAASFLKNYISELQKARASLASKAAAAQKVAAQFPKNKALPAEITNANTVGTLVDQFLNNLTGVANGSSTSAFGQISLALYIADAMANGGFTLVLHFAALGGSSVTEGETFWHNPRVTYQYSQLVSGVLIDKAGRLIALPDTCTSQEPAGPAADCGLQGGGLVPIDWH
ncbi:hypothetical protein P9239_00355 [Caballeronia sp. LZ062]|uniref:hypothetical protein n=1 Tax=unclassified Caballeronia TaxID=2646786 RepID=UPI0028638782|nr:MULTISPECIES: hypothetical protein [unclassified Caballeronia]MDR5857257.1 hypothetical protein [Caballeronia sp. LZ050]MDR5868808.1 hypothetical protein [Caballeronia sp. LZ062]